MTLDNNKITNCVNSAGAVPEPATLTLALVGGLVLGLPSLGKRLRRI